MIRGLEDLICEERLERVTVVQLGEEREPYCSLSVFRDLLRRLITRMTGQGVKV